MITTFVVLNTFSLAYAGPFDFMNQDKKEEKKTDDKKVDLDKLSLSGKMLIIRVSQATKAFSESALIMLKALNLKEQSEKINALLEDLKKSPEDQEKIKKLNSATNEAIDEINKAKITEKSKLDISNKELINSFTYTAAGIIIDTKAINDASNLLKECEILVNYVKADPLKYGFSALPTVNSVISSSKFIAENIPEQMKGIKTFSDTLVKVLKVKKLSIPPASEIQKISENILKE